mgnify:FL=1
MKENQLDYIFALHGGLLIQAFAICDQIQCSATPVWIYASGEACSAGFLILTCGDRRMAYENTTLMYHQLSWGSGYGKVRDIDETNDQVKKDQERLEKFILNNTNITKDRLEFMNERKKDWYMDVKEAQKLGVIDEIIKSKKKK